jgi:CelD/BcsL family acetyltransferase involved in cellulose biosynthesis
MIACPVRFELIDRSECLHRLEPEWRAFERRVPPATPFQTPEWLLTWWSHFGSGILRTFVFREDSRIVGIVPCFVHRWNGRRQVTLIGSGISDFLDPPLDPSYSDVLVAALRAELGAFDDWDLCDWQDLSEATPLAALGESREDTSCSELATGPHWDSFLEGRPRYLKRNLRRAFEAGNRMGGLRFAVDRDADPDLLECLIEQHGARWRAAAGESGTIAANRSEAFLREVAGRLAERDLLRIFSLRLDSQVVAVILGMRAENTIFSYLTAFHPAYGKYGFGHHLLCRAIQYAHEQGCRWNFLRGEEQYKLDWGARRIPKRRVLIARPGVE